MVRHTGIGRADVVEAKSNPYVDSRRFGRMFPDLPPHDAGREHMIEIGQHGGIMDDGYDDAPDGDSQTIPAGYLFLSQCMAHDITFDLDSSLDVFNDPEAVTNFRVHPLDLDSVYGAGPRANSFLYDVNDPDKLLLGINDRGNPDDVPRNTQGTAIMGDPRDDTDLICSQLHLAFMKFHNCIVDHLRESGTPSDKLFREAQRLTRWHFQWIVIHDYLVLHVGQAVVDDILTHGGRYYRPREMSFLPVEFAVGSFRFGHAQTRSNYQVNSQVAAKLFDLPSFGAVPADHVVDWSYFFDIDPAQPPQPCRKIRAKYPGVLMEMPEVFGNTPEMRSLAVRDLLRGYAFNLPSGQAVAEAMGYQPLTCAEMGIDDYDGPITIAYYLLKEAEYQTQGERLGEMGSRLVAEVIIGLIQSDPRSFLYNEPTWQPTLPGATPGTFTITDLLRFAGVA